MLRNGEVLCALCSGTLTVHDCYPRHCRDEEGKRHYGWIAQGHCDVCKVYPALIPSFIKPYKHYKADVIERVIEKEEAGENVENKGGCAADASTMRRWVKQFKERGERAAGCLVSKLPIGHKAQVGSLDLSGMTPLQQLSRLLREYQMPERSGVIGNVNVILTTRNCGFL
jgi:transposase-like protein